MFPACEAADRIDLRLADIQEKWSFSRRLLPQDLVDVYQGKEVKGPSTEDMARLKELLQPKLWEIPTASSFEEPSSRYLTWTMDELLFARAQVLQLWEILR